MSDETAMGNKPPAEIQHNEHMKAFFLDLAAKGKEEWNKWRGAVANKDVLVTFEGVDFSQAPRDEINFEGFEFGYRADFLECKWRGDPSIYFFRESFRPGRASFKGASFHLAYFNGASFGDGADFTRAALRVAFFSGAVFGAGASFTGATFDGLTEFTGTAFGDKADFTGADFGDLAFFNHTIFRGLVTFTGKSKEQWTEDFARVHSTRTEASAALENRHNESWKRTGSRPDRFLTIRFGEARFDGEADFSRRSFEQIADFTGARFYSPPNFDGAANTARIHFTGAHIGFVPPGELLHWTEDTRIPIRLRALRKLAEDTKNHDLERDLYIEERKAERGVYWRQLLDELKKAPEELKKQLEDINHQKKHVWLESRFQARARNAHRLGITVKIARLFTHLLWIAVLAAYWALADYGRSFARPALWLVLSVPCFYWGYANVLAPLMPKAGALNADKYERAVGMLALGNAVPFVGPLTIDADIKKFLFCPGREVNCLPIPPEGYQLLVLGQNLVSITLVFFIGLALRNYFRIK